KIQKTVRDLRKHLPWLVAEYERAEPSSPAAKSIRVLVDALEQALPHIGAPPERGTRAPWQTYAAALLGPIEHAWRATGCARLSWRTPEGPMIKVLCDALRAIDGEERGEAAIVQGLRRRRRKG